MKIEALYLRECRMRLEHPFQASIVTTLDLFVCAPSNGGDLG
jgi:hypothetical protein